MLKLVGLSVAVAMAGAGLLAFVLHEDNASALSSSTGFVDTGSKFGIRMGDHISTVDRTIGRHGFRIYERTGEGRACLQRIYPPSQGIAVYVDDSWRRGTACVAYGRNSGRIESIQWSYAAFSIDL